MKSGAYANGVPGDGNISSKSDVGTYTYGGSGAGPHAVTSIQSCAGCNVNGQTNPTFSYDADGNMTADAGRTAQYTSFDIASSVGQGNNVTSFTFTPEHGRGSRTFNGNTMYYLDNPAAGVSEELWTGATSQWDTYLTPYGHIAAELFTTGGTTTPYYFVGDHLESVTALSDANGNQKEYHSFDAWGNGRAKNGNDQAACPGLHPPSLTLRGYTGQETISSYCIIDLNARNYDPAIGRMMGGDPVVQYPYDGQSFNRYSYVENGPLSATDPSGYDLWYTCGSDNHCRYVGGVGAANVDVDGENPGAEESWGADGFGGNGAGGGSGSPGGGGGGGGVIGGSDSAALLSAGAVGWSLADLAQAGQPGNITGGYIDTYIQSPDPQALDANNPLITTTGYAWFEPGILPAGWGGVTGTWDGGATGSWGERGTFAITVMIGGQLGPIRPPTFSGGIAFDANGNIALLGSVGGGSTAAVPTGTGGIFGINFSFSDALSVYDLRGFFADQSIFAADGIGVGFNSFEGNSPDGLVYGGGITLGAGEGVSLDIGLSDTLVH